MHLQDFIVLKLRKEEGTVSMIKDYQSFHQRHIFINVKASTLSSEVVRLKIVLHGQAQVHVNYGL